MYQRYSGIPDKEAGGGSIMKKTTIGGTKRKVTNILAMLGLIIIFIAYMFPFIMVVINSLKQKRDIIKSPFSWLFTIKGLSFDNFVKAYTQMDFLNAFKNSLIVTVSACSDAGVLYRPPQQRDLKAYVRADGGIYDHPVPGDHDPTGEHLRRDA